MAYGGAAGGAAAAYYYMANATKASGAIVMLPPEEFKKMIMKLEKPIIIFSPPGFLSNKNKYLTHYRGFTFYAKTSEEFQFGGDVEFIKADKIWVPE